MDFLILYIKIFRVCAFQSNGTGKPGSQQLSFKHPRWLSILVVLTNHYIRPIAYIFILQGFKDADAGDLGGNSGHEFLGRSWANESQGNGENFCIHSANLTSSSQVGKSFDFLEANQDMSQTTRLSDEDATGSFSPILVYSKSLRPSIEVLTLNF